ncbi:MAG: hypothetical protein DRI44_04375 [Chlamydiae bacterium]|nr:MAG: hypothetical protein DRI44_04375 [Chlamydiota bacterium]
MKKLITFQLFIINVATSVPKHLYQLNEVSYVFTSVLYYAFIADEILIFGHSHTHYCHYDITA